MFRFSKQSLIGFLFASMFIIWGFSSCVTPKRVIYFNDIKDSSQVNKPYTIENVTKYVTPVIQSNDILMVTVLTSAQNETNTPTNPSTKATFDPLSGYLVDKNGNIELSLIGFVKVAGLTTAEARELVKEKAKEFYKEPVVNVRIANFDVYFLGEILVHGPISFPSEKVNILEALASAGDIPLTGKKSNVLLIRTEGDQKKLVRFDMNSSEIFKSPYFYLKQRDIIYVEPTKYRIQSSDNRISRNIAIVSSILSFATLVLAFRNIK